VLPYLQASERELPESPAPSAVLANAYASLNRFDEALAAIDRAISKAPPVLRISLVSVKAGMFQKKGDSAAARRTWDEAVHLAEELPSSPRFAKMVAWTKTQREKAMAAAPAKVAQP
jgi:tetratricopeptide (TPR) repeat protein